MQRENREKNIILKDFIKREYSNISFIDLMRLLKSYYINLSYDELFDIVHIEPKLSLAFQVSDIDSIEVDEEKCKIITNFLSLYGTTAPLPIFYTEDLILERNELDSNLVKDFYNIFNNIKYKQYFFADLKYKLPRRIIENEENKIYNILFSFIGQNYNNKLDNLKYHSKENLLYYSNLFLHTNKSVEGLKLLLNGLLNVEVDIAEYIKTYIDIQKRFQSSLGTVQLLGDNIHLGNKIVDIRTTFKIILYDLDKTSFNYFQKKNIGFQKLKELVDIYIDKSYRWIVEYRLREPYKYTKLSEDNWANLGENSWINSNEKEYGC